MDSINVPALILEFKKASANAQVTAMHRLINSLDDRIVISSVERGLWKLYRDGRLPARLHEEVMSKIKKLPNSKFRKNVYTN